MESVNIFFFNLIFYIFTSSANIKLRYVDFCFISFILVTLDVVSGTYEVVL